MVSPSFGVALSTTLVVTKSASNTAGGARGHDAPSLLEVTALDKTNAAVGVAVV